MGTYKGTVTRIETSPSGEIQNNKSSLLCRPSESQITQETDLIREVIEFARNKEMDRDSEMERRSFVVVMVNAGEQNLRDEWV